MHSKSNNVSIANLISMLSKNRRMYRSSGKVGSSCKGRRSSLTGRSSSKSKSIGKTRVRARVRQPTVKSMEKCSICGRHRLKKSASKLPVKSRTHSKTHPKTHPKTHVGCTACGCGRNRSKTKLVAIYRRPNNGKMVVKMMNLNKKNNRGNRPNRPNRARIHNTLLMNKRPYNNNTDRRGQSRKVVRKMINRILSRKNHTRRHNLVSMMHNMMDKNTKRNNRVHSNNSNYSLMNSNSGMTNSGMTNSGMTNSHSSMVSSSSYLNSNMNQPVKKSKKVQSYYTSHNDGNHHTEKGRRIVDDSNLPFIKINKLNNGMLETSHIPRN
jgi:hypothetical protein